MDALIEAVGSFLLGYGTLGILLIASLGLNVMLLRSTWPALRDHLTATAAQMALVADALDKQAQAREQTLLLHTKLAERLETMRGGASDLKDEVRAMRDLLDRRLS